jgi:hypothetical protein
VLLAPSPSAVGRRDAIAGASLGASPLGEGTVGTTRDGGGISVTAGVAGVAATSSDAGAFEIERAFALASPFALAIELIGAALGAPPGVVAGARPSLVKAALAAGTLGATGRMLGGIGRMLEDALGGLGRMLGGGGRGMPRTGGGGGVPDGRAAGATLLVAGRGGSETGRGGCATGRGGATDADAGASLACGVRFSCSLAVPCSSPMGLPQTGRLQHTATGHRFRSGTTMPGPKFSGDIGKTCNEARDCAILAT